MEEQLGDAFMAGAKILGQDGTQRRHRVEVGSLRWVERCRQELSATMTAEEHGFLSVAGRGLVPLP